jgi:hypothetical protein
MTLCRYAVCHCAECSELFIVMLNVIMLSVMLNVVMLSVVAPFMIQVRAEIITYNSKLGS